MKLQDKLPIDLLHKQSLSCFSGIEAFRKDLGYLRGRLQEVASKNTGREIHVKIEQFQNKFIVQDYELSKLLHDIRNIEQKLAREAKNITLEAPYQICEEHTVLIERYETSARLFIELKKEFNRFLSQVL